MSAGRIYLDTLRTTASRAGFLIAVGVLVFVPLGLLDAAVDRAGSIHIAKLSDLGDLTVAAAIVGFIAQVATALVGEVFYSGAVALRLAPGPDPSLREVAGGLSYGRLIAVDLLFGVAIAVGLVLLIVPGIIFFTWFALAGPIVELEGRGVRSALRRSRALVRGRFWMVLGVLVPITLASEALADAILPATHYIVGSAFIADWLGEAAANVITSPFYAVAAVLITLRLSGPRLAG